jgi:hypothetical protein
MAESLTLRVHLHDSTVQETWAAPDHLGLRFALTADVPVTGQGVTIQGSYDSSNWVEVATLEADTTEEFDSDYNFLRVYGYGGTDTAENGTLVITYLAEAPVSETEAAEAASPGLALQLDDVGAGVVYIGEALPGSTTSSASWRIKRLTETGADLSIEWAGGTADFDKIWDNRLALSYS